MSAIGQPNLRRIMSTLFHQALDSNMTDRRKVTHNNNNNRKNLVLKSKFQDLKVKDFPTEKLTKFRSA